jgi:hypothetical protein
VESWWLAPLVVLSLSGIALLVAGASARRAAGQLAVDRPALEAVQADLLGLHEDIARVAARVEGTVGGAGAGTADR